MTKTPRSLLLLAGSLAPLSAIAVITPAAIVMDNTDDLSATPTFNSGSAPEGSRHHGVLFDVEPDHSLALDTLTIPLQYAFVQSGTSDVTVSFFETANNFEYEFSEPAVGSVTQEFSFASGGPVWLSFDLSSITLAAGTRHAMVVSSVRLAGDFFLMWNGIQDATQISDMNGSLYLDPLQSIMSTDSGSTWSAIGNTYGTRLTATPIPVPEPSTYALFAGTLAICAGVLRRRKRNS